MLSNCTRKGIAKKNRRLQTPRTSSFPLQMAGIRNKRGFQISVSEFCKDWSTLKDTYVATKMRAQNWKGLWTRKVRRMTLTEPLSTGLNSIRVKHMLIVSPMHGQELRSLSFTQITSYSWLPEATEPRKLRSRSAIITQCYQLWMCVLGLLEQRGPWELRVTDAGRRASCQQLIVFPSFLFHKQSPQNT